MQQEVLNIDLKVCLLLFIPPPSKNTNNSVELAAVCDFFGLNAKENQAM